MSKHVYFWVDDELADKLEAIKREVEKGNLDILNKTIKESITQDKNLFEDMDIHIKELKLYNEKSKLEIAKQYQEYIEQLEETYEQFYDEVYKKARGMNESLVLLMKDVNNMWKKIEQTMQDFPGLYKLEKAVELIDKISKFSDSEKELLEKLFKLKGEKQ